MSGAARHAAAVLVRYRRILLVAAGLASLLSAAALGGLRVSNALDVWYPPGDPVLRDYADYVARFGNDDVIVVAVERSIAQDAKEPPEVSGLADRILGIDGVADVLSPASPGSGGDGPLQSQDGRTAGLLVYLAVDDAVETRRPAIVRSIRAAAAGEGYRARFAGFGIIYDGLNAASTEGSAALLLLAEFAMLVALWAAFGRFGPVLLALAAVGLATLWTLGAYAASGAALTMVTMALPTLVMVIGLASSVHLMRAIAKVPADLSREQRVAAGVEAVIGPCTVSALTTAVGFLAVAGTDLPAVRALGIFGAVGVLAGLAAALIVVVGGVTATGWLPARTSGRHFSRLASTLAATGPARPIGISVAFAVLSLGAGLGIQRLDVDTWSLGYLPEDHPVRQDSDYVESRLGRYATLDFVVSAESVREPAVLDAVQAWQDRALDLPGVAWTWSGLDTAGIDRATRPSSLDERVLSGQFARLDLLSPALARRWWDGRTALRVTFGVPVLSARDAAAMVDRIAALAVPGPGQALRPDGYAVAYTHIVARLLGSQVAGFAAAFLTIVAVIGLALRSTRRAALAVPGSLVPVVVTLGAMGWAGIPLDVATVTIAGIVLGLVVDDSVHLLWPHGTGALGEGIRRSAALSGNALVTTTLVTSAGFLVLATSEIRSVAWFGALAALAMVVALLADLLLLPALASLRAGPRLAAVRTGERRAGA